MTDPIPTGPVPSKAKAWWALVIPLIASLAPTIAQLADVIPAPWGPVLTGIGIIFAALTGGTVHEARYVPKGAELTYR